MLNQGQMTKWELPGVPAGGLRTVGQIRGTNTLLLHAGGRCSARVHRIHQ